MDKHFTISNSMHLDKDLYFQNTKVIKVFFGKQLIKVFPLFLYYKIYINNES